MKRKWKMLLASLLTGIMITSTAVGATTIDGATVSDDTLPKAKADLEETIADKENAGYSEFGMLTAEEIERELSAKSPNGQDVLKTEGGAGKYLFLGDSVMCGGYTDQAGNGVASFVTYLDQMRPSFMINKAVGGATYSTVH